MKLQKTMLAASLLGLVGFAQISTAHNDGGYSHDSGAVANNVDWMSRLSGNLKVSEINLPGTHDTMSIKSGDIWQNQTMTLRQQLDSGVRVFDMRTRHINDTFRMHHGIIAQDTYFDDVLKDIDGFLEAHPTETVLFRLRSEHTPENNTRSYAETLEEYLAEHGGKRWVPTNNNPTLNEIRGKFVILQEFSGGTYGLSYGAIDKQDDYKLDTNWDLYDKWIAVKDHMEKSESGSRDTLYMNYLSGAGGSFPYFVASGHSSPDTSAPRLATGLTTPGWANSYPDFPRTSCFIGICTISFEGTNTLTADYIANGQAGFVGMVMADFPGKKLIENVINMNDLSGYTYKEFNWGSGTDENTRLCNGSSACVEGDAFTDNAPARKDKLTVVSYNVKRPSAANIQNQIEWLKDKYGAQGPDVILLSETQRGASCGAGRNTAREYAKAFNGYYVNANEDGPSSSCQTGNAIVSRYPMGNVGMIRFNAQSDGSWSNNPQAGRNAVYADINVGGDVVHVYSIHTHHSFGIEGDSIRKKQHAEMVQHAEGKPYSKVLGGDFNAIGHVFADPIGLHDISLNPVFDKGYADAHDSLSTSGRITSEAGLLDGDWTLILDFIFAKDGSTSNAGLCTSDYCRNSDVMSDHVPIWADISFAGNGAALSAIKINEMKSGDRFSFKLATKIGSSTCKMEWDGGESNGERNAKFDCNSAGDELTFVVNADPWVDHNGYQATRGYILTLDGTCGLEWDGSLQDDNERNAKWDCSSGKDEVYLTSHADGGLDDVIITTVSNICGLQWEGGSGVERDAKFDCDPSWDTFSMVELRPEAITPATMQQGDTYGMTIHSVVDHCGLEWGGFIAEPERIAKFDCSGSADPVQFIATDSPVDNGNGTTSVSGKLYSHGGSCGLEWGGVTSGSDRKAKWDCAGNADPLVITTKADSNDVYIHASNGCGLEWSLTSVNNEREAKWDCNGSVGDSSNADSLTLSGVTKQ
ncbi:phosphatidylinositol-specific phospholipase C domain-containing protein [Bacterioplanoides sp. SCSIO 12839]|uniref:phosphatidylinositol-specific phospholipase C domain-containing protein n=1 Tax=Bacterioplanoides sp. SCSIO 12839 TaxID=2829569 RepID=UPI002101F82F|nr:phosphatidylinositol-specific phospholipase C domain-containing protein [Bacterioplanoides sp. SCSIO 12839]UTW49939.1 phosphatidylinositol-specific phospholipase C domain-containing protein [Bacterioplanoides sp. SCSIO 12839]